MKKIFASLNIFLAVTLSVGNFFYLGDMDVDIFLGKKWFCSGVFALLGLINLCYALLSGEKDKKYPAFMAIGLLLAFAGDIAINKNFIAGAALFALGHVFYTVSYCFIEKINKRDVFVSGGIFALAAAFLLLCPLLDFGGDLFLAVCVVYALIISCMLGKALSNFIRRRTAVSIVILVGSILFFFSDLMLVFDWFMDMGRIAGLLCMSTYYPAQFLLAFSVFTKTAKLGYKKNK